MTANVERSQARAVKILTDIRMERIVWRWRGIRVAQPVVDIARRRAHDQATKDVAALHRAGLL